MADDKNPFSLEDILWEYADYTPPAICSFICLDLPFRF